MPCVARRASRWSLARLMYFESLYPNYVYAVDLNVDLTKAVVNSVVSHAVGALQEPKAGIWLSLDECPERLFSDMQRRENHHEFSKQ